MIDVTAATIGLSTPPGDLITQIGQHGWEVTKLEFSKKEGYFVAEGKNAHGEKVSKWGKTDSVALGNLLVAVLRHTHMRTARLRAKMGAWDNHFLDKMEDIARQYAEAEHWTVEGASAFKMLADDSVHRAEVLGRQLHIEITDDPHPYLSIEELVDDLHNNKHFEVSRSNPEHPVWSVDQVIAFRTVHSIMGHGVAGAGFDWEGVNAATGAHMGLLRPLAQQALFTQTIARTAYATYTQGLAPPKVVLFPEFMEAAQSEHQGFGHKGVHPSQITAPEPLPGLPKIAAELDHQGVLDANRGQNLQGLPGPVGVPSIGKVQFHSHKGIQDIAHSYMAENGIGQPHPTDYTKVHPETSAQIAQAYEQMPHAPNDPKVKASYEALARETRAQYDHAVKHGYNFEFYPKDRDPYPNSPREAVLDLHHNNHMYVYPTDDGFGSHEEEEYQGNPLLADSGVRWGGKPVTHNDLFRAIHDFYGHAKEGLGFRADGEDNAWRQHAAMFSPLARKAMTAETRGQNSWVNFGPHGEANQTASTEDTVFAPQKTGILPDWVEDVNLHRGQLAPATGGKTSAKRKPGQPYDPTLLDPNKDWESGIEPNHSTTNGLGNAYLEHGDPLQIQKAQDNTALIERHWWDFKTADGQPDIRRMEQTVANALRTAILSPKKELRWNAIHYQHLSHIPAHVDDPDVYWNALEKHRQEWNVERYGEDARFKHRPWYGQDPTPKRPTPQKEWVFPHKRLKAMLEKHYPKLDSEEKLESTIRQWVTEEQDRLWREDMALPEEKQRTIFEIDNEAFKMVAKRLHLVVQDVSKSKAKKSVPKALDHFVKGASNPDEPQIGMKEIADAGRYGAFMGGQLKAIAKIGQNIEKVTQAALTDVTEHDGTGHHFRSVVMQMAVPNVGPKVCSFAWLFLCPNQSELATVDTHIMDMLGIKEGQLPNRDYFRAERQFKAARDAAGYGHVPLGAFQWAAWDWKRTGEAQDHSPMAVDSPVPYDKVMWHPIEKDPHAPKGMDWMKKVSPDWWTNTAHAMEKAGQDFDEHIGSQFAKDTIPFKGLVGRKQKENKNPTPTYPGSVPWERAPVVSRKWSIKSLNASSMEHSAAEHVPEEGEFHASIKVPEKTLGEIEQLVETLDFNFRAEDPSNYHMTWFFIKDDKGHRDELKHDMEVGDFEATGPELLFKFDNARIDTFPARDDSGEDTVVIRFDSDDARKMHDIWENDFVDEYSIDPGPFAGDYKPHITIGWTKESVPSKKLDLSFTSEGFEVSPAAGIEKESALTKETRIQRLKRENPGLSTRELWAQASELPVSV